MWNLFKKKTEVQPWYKKLWVNFKGLLLSSVLIASALTYWYGFVAPDFTPFEKDTKVDAIVYDSSRVEAARPVFVAIQTNKLPDTPVTIEFIVDGSVLSHRHYPQGIPTVRGRSFAEGKEAWIEAMTLTFKITSPEMTIRFTFQGWETLGKPVVFVFKTLLQASTPKPKDSNVNVPIEEDKGVMV